MRWGAFGVGLVAAIALPAEAAVPPMDLARGEIAVSVGLPAAGCDLSLGRLVIGGAATGFAVPTLVYGYGFAAHVGWRLSGLPRREPCFGFVLVGGAGSLAGGLGTLPGGAAAASGSLGSGEAWFAQPALAVALPLGPAVTLRAAGGPAFFVAHAAGAGGGSDSRGVLPFVPNVELAVRLTEGHELLVGGLPNVLGWRGTF